MVVARLTDKGLSYDEHVPGDSGGQIGAIATNSPATNHLVRAQTKINSRRAGLRRLRTSIRRRINARCELILFSTNVVIKIK